MYKQYMIVFEWIDNGNKKETFYFDSFDAVRKFCNGGGIRVEAVFKLQNVTDEVFI